MYQLSQTKQRLLMKSILFAGLLTSSLFYQSNFQYLNDATHIFRLNKIHENSKSQNTQAKIQVALLLDTSSSMDGLIDQAKSQLWQIINELASARYAGQQPKLEIALYEYGNDGISSSHGYVKQITDFTGDLDKISESLYKLTTNGGSEYCGTAINTAVQQLEWSVLKNDMKLIYIAGNEPFDQGKIDFRNACKSANNKGIIVNTIYCGQIDEGIRYSWKEGADITHGNYFNIDQNQVAVHIQTPWDNELVELNIKLNQTYIAYGEKGVVYKSNMEEQDKNAEVYGSGNMVARVNSKSSGVYNAQTWDLVDASKNKDFDVSKLKKEDLPIEMQSMNKNEQLQYIDAKKKEREAIQSKIHEINKKREAYIKEIKNESTNDNSLGTAMKKSIREIGLSMNYSFDK